MTRFLKLTNAANRAIFALSLPLLASPLLANGIAVDSGIYSWSETDTPNNAADLPGGLRTSFGPFHVVGHDRAELAGSIETDTPAQFHAMLKAFPSIKQIDMVDCPGTGDDEANFTLARMIRRAGIATYVPGGGFVASGGVELFLAGVHRRADPDAEFAVHSWRDSDGLEAADFANDDPVNVTYINYYREMGMGEAQARAFYALTNSVNHDDALYLKAADIARYIRLD